MTVETAVYFDPEFPSTWIDKTKKYPEKIAQAFSAKKFSVIDAAGLKEFMSKALDTNLANQKLVVFSQDVVPSTIVESYSSSNTLRQFLDAGGSILWIGDIPLWSIGEKNEKKEIANVGGPIEILGINPVFSVPSSAVVFSPLGRNVGLRTSGAE